MASKVGKSTDGGRHGTIQAEQSLMCCRGVKQDFVFARSHGKPGVFMNDKRKYYEQW